MDRAYQGAMRTRFVALALAVAASSVAGAPTPSFADLAPLTLQDELRDGDDQCTNLCDRYAFVWEPATEVELRLVTDGFAAYINVDGAAVHEVSENPGRELRMVFVTAARSVPYTVLINAYNYYDRGRYRLEVRPRPLRWLVPTARPVVPQASPEERESDEDVLSTVDALTRGLRPAGREVRGRLDRLGAVRFATKRGRCYRALVVLDSDARWRRPEPPAGAPTATVRMQVRSTLGARDVLPSAHTTARVVALDDEVCPSANGTAELTFEDRANGEALRDAGTGGFVARLYERTIRTAP